VIKARAAASAAIQPVPSAIVPLPAPSASAPVPKAAPRSTSFGSTPAPPPSVPTSATK